MLPDLSVDEIKTISVGGYILLFKDLFLGLANPYHYVRLLTSSLSPYIRGSGKLVA